MFWVERLARRTGFNTLSQSLLGEERYAPYLLVVTVLFIDAPVLSTVHYFFSDSGGALIWWRWPGLLWFLLPVVVISAVFSLRGLRKRYNSAARGIGRTNINRSTMETGFPVILQYSLLLLGLSIYVVVISATVGSFFVFEDSVINVNNIVEGIKWLLFIPLIYIPLGTDLATAYAHIQLVLPLRILRKDIPIDFSDPKHLGGMYPVGRTMRFAAISVFAALTLYTLFAWVFINIWNTSLSQMSRSVTISFFAFAWVSSTGAFLIGVYILHRHMRTKRQEQLDQCYEEIRKLGGDDETLPYTEPSNDAEFQEYMREYVNLNRVERTSTFPFNVIVAWEMFAAALFPVVLQIVSIIASSSL